MTRRDEVLALLARNPEGLTDAELARITGASHQTINQTCRQLAAEGLIRRDGFGSPITNFGTGVRPPDRPAATADRPDWFWEGNIQAGMVRYLSAQGGVIRSVVDTASKARGTDIVASLHGRVLHIEVKGWPSTTYADPRRADEIKRTQPTNQASHWFAGAVLSALRLRGKNPDDRVLMVFPDFPRYRNLADETAATLRTVDVEIWFVKESGAVSAYTE
jgi:MarR family protein